MNKDIRDKINQYGAQVDHFTIDRKYEELKLLLDEMKHFSQTNEEVKNDADFNYYLGTGYGTYSNYVIWSGKPHTDKEVIELRKWSMYYYRRGIALFDPDIHTNSRVLLRILTNYANGLYRYKNTGRYSQ